MDGQEAIDEINEFNFQNNINNLNLIQLLDFVDEPKRKYIVRERIDPFVLYDDDEFTQRYRMSKTMVHTLYDLIDGRHTLEPMVRTNYMFVFLYAYSDYMFVSVRSRSLHNSGHLATSNCATILRGGLLSCATRRPVRSIEIICL